jgi:aminoglycoside phosphotransferase family enzyme
MPDAQAKLTFLQTPESYGATVRSVTCIETHMSWVFLTETRAFKLKKPVRFPFLDFTGLQAREFYCREEVRLNQRTAPGVYLGVMALHWNGADFSLVGQDGLPGAGETVDWLVVMQRLPSQRMLDHLIVTHSLAPGDLATLAATLGSFFQSAPPAPMTPAAYLQRFADEHAANRIMLQKPQFELADAGHALGCVETIRERMAVRLSARVLGQHVVDGHGDLRPEHICMLQVPLVIDCVEFKPVLRHLDPLDEVSFLALECHMLGDPMAGRDLIDGVVHALGEPADPGLLHFYTAHRALLRAHLAVAHLLDAHPRTPQKWIPRAERYVAHALAASADWFNAATRDGWP